MMDLIVSWLCTAIAGAFGAATDFFCNIFGYDIATFNATFTFAGQSYEIIRNIGLALALLLAGWQILTFFLKGSEATVSPIRAALNGVIAVAFIFYGNYLLELVLDFCQYPYDAIQAMSPVTNVGSKYAGWNGIGNVVIAYLNDAFAGGNMLLYLIMIILICFSFIKLLLEIVERYVVTFVLLYLSPLAASTLASNSTSGIYKKFITMFFSQCILLFLNVWCLNMACSALNITGQPDNKTLIVPFLLCYAFLRISAKMDSYINQLGLNAAITGGGLGAEIFATGASLLRAGKDGHGGGDGGGNKILGAAKAVQTYANRYNPAAAIGKSIADRAVGANAGFSEAYRTGGSVIAGAKSGWQEGGKNSDNLFARHAQAHKTQNEQLVGTAKATDAEDAANRKAWSSNAHLAHDAFSYVQNTGSIADTPEDVSAIASGLGVGNYSKEAAEIINVGLGQERNDVIKDHDFEYKLDHTGMHFQHLTNDGYRHKLDVVNRSQFDKLSTEGRAGMSQFRTPDGHRYYWRTTKEKIDPVPSLGKEGFTLEHTGQNGKIYTQTTYSQAQYNSLPETDKQWFTEGRDGHGRKVYTRVTSPRTNSDTPEQSKSADSADNSETDSESMSEE